MLPLKDWFGINSNIFYPNGLDWEAYEVPEPVEKKPLTTKDENGMWVITDYGQYHTNHIFDIRIVGVGNERIIELEESNGSHTIFRGEPQSAAELNTSIYSALAEGRIRFSIPEWIKWKNGV